MRPGRACSTSALTIEKTAVLAPIPSANTSTATKVKPGVRRSRRSVSRRSRSITTSGRATVWLGSHSEGHHCHLFVPHDRDLPAGIVHVEELPRELVGGKRQRAER